MPDSVWALLLTVEIKFFNPSKRVIFHLKEIKIAGKFGGTREQYNNLVSFLYPEPKFNVRKVNIY